MAEGSSGYFDVNPPRGKQFSEAVLDERLAPEPLVDMMCTPRRQPKKNKEHQSEFPRTQCPWFQFAQIEVLTRKRSTKVDFRLTSVSICLEEKTEVGTNCDRIAKLKFSRSLPFAFTEHSAIQATNLRTSGMAFT